MTSTQHRAKQFQAIKGVRDILPPESALWNRVEQAAREVFGTFGFAEIRLPIIEQTDLFARSVGQGTDIISKEMYTIPDGDIEHIRGLRRSLVEWEIKFGDFKDAELFLGLVVTLLTFIRQAQEDDLTQFEEVGLEALGDLTNAAKELSDLISARSDSKDTDTWKRLTSVVDRIRLASDRLEIGEDMSLRPEGTASVVRAYIEHGMQVLPGPLKFYYIGPMFRRERPQKGRYRQFYQIGAEVLGKGVSVATDAEVIAMLMNFFEWVGLSNHTLFINSIGCRAENCRPAYLALLRVALLKIKDKLEPDSQRRIETNPLRVLDSKIESEQPYIEALPRITSCLCASCKQEYESLKSILNSRGVKFKENWRLVRGLDYYTETTFEVTVPGAGAQNAICGGGRYDGLVELLGGPKFSGINGVGFAIGEDRLIDAVRDSGKLAAILPLEIYVAWMGNVAEKAQELAKMLRENGFGVEVPAEAQRLGKSINMASRKGARFVIIVGENEILSGKYIVKRLADSEQKELSEEEMIMLFEKEIKR